MAEHDDGRRLSDRATRAAHRAIDEVGERAAHVEDRLRETADRATHRAREEGDRARAEVDESLRELSRYIERNPLTAAALAFAAGVLVTAVLNRR